MKLPRREFLARMLAAGAAIAAPGKLAECSDAQIDSIWEKLLEEPWHFDVDPHGTITNSGANEPHVRSDVFDEVFYVNLTNQCTIESFLLDIKECEPLLSHFQQLASEELFEIESRLEDDLGHDEEDSDNSEDAERLSESERERLKHLAKVLNDDWNGWEAMVRNAGVNGLPRFKDEVKRWLASPIELRDWEWVECEGAQVSAMRFFQDIPSKILDELGVEIIEGEHPGSTYYAAELRKPVVDANYAAKQMGLPFQFRS
jgi:hypothetical protein